MTYKLFKWVYMFLTNEGARSTVEPSSSPREMAGNRLIQVSQIRDVTKNDKQPLFMLLLTT